MLQGFWTSDVARILEEWCCKAFGRVMLQDFRKRCCKAFGKVMLQGIWKSGVARLWGEGWWKALRRAVARLWEGGADMPAGTPPARRMILEWKGARALSFPRGGIALQGPPPLPFTAQVLEPWHVQVCCTHVRAHVHACSPAHVWAAQGAGGLRLGVKPKCKRVRACLQRTRFESSASALVACRCAPMGSVDARPWAVWMLAHGQCGCAPMGSVGARPWAVFREGGCGEGGCRFQGRRLRMGLQVAGREVAGGLQVAGTEVAGGLAGFRAGGCGGLAGFRAGGCRGLAGCRDGGCGWLAGCREGGCRFATGNHKRRTRQDLAAHLAVLTSSAALALFDQSTHLAVLAATAPLGLSDRHGEVAVDEAVQHLLRRMNSAVHGTVHDVVQCKGLEPHNLSTLAMLGENAHSNVCDACLLR
eukprot:359744-Chlamydomonas_euryale.AAC.6